MQIGGNSTIQAAVPSIRAAYGTAIGKLGGTSIAADTTTTHEADRRNIRETTQTAPFTFESWFSKETSTTPTTSWPRITRESRAEKASAAITDFSTGFNPNDISSNTALIKKVIASRIALRAKEPDNMRSQAGMKTSAPAEDTIGDATLNKVTEEVKSTIESNAALKNLRTELTTANTARIDPNRHWCTTGLLGMSGIAGILNRRIDAALEATQLRAQEKLSKAALKIVLENIDQKAATEFNTQTSTLATAAALSYGTSQSAATNLERTLKNIKAPAAFSKFQFSGRTWNDRLQDRTELATRAKNQITVLGNSTDDNSLSQLHSMGVQGACLRASMTAAYKDVIDKHATAVEKVTEFSSDQATESKKTAADTALKEVDKAMAKAEKMQSLVQQHIQNTESKNTSASGFDDNIGFFASFDLGDLLEALLNS